MTEEKKPGLFYRDEAGHEYRLKVVKGAAEKGTIIMQYKSHLMLGVMEELERQLSNRIGEKVIVIDAQVERVLRIDR